MNSNICRRAVTIVQQSQFKLMRTAKIKATSIVSNDTTNVGSSISLKLFKHF